MRQRSDPNVELIYSRSVFEAILVGAGPHDGIESEMRCGDQGVWFTPEISGGHPMSEIMGSDSPDPLVVPHLPFPFTARALAALLIMDVAAIFIGDRYGEWADGPDEEAFARLGSEGGKAREVLGAAYKAIRHAIARAPMVDLSLEQSVQTLGKRRRRASDEANRQQKVFESGISREEWSERRRRAQQSIRGLEQKLSEARNAADHAYSRWRAAVVQHLLLPVHKVPDEAFDSELLRMLPADRREEAVWQQQEFGDFQACGERNERWTLISERGVVETELRRWQLMNPQSVTEADIHEGKVKNLKARLLVVKQSLEDLNSAPQLGATSTAPEPAVALLATRASLVEAFGGYGLQRRWFDELNSHRWLLNARKREGHGQRGAVIEPMFCPFEVMNGLVRESRKSHLTSDAGWRILEHRFPAVYEANAKADPREPTG